MKIKTKESKGGFVIEISPIKKTILSCTSTGGNKISLNDTVVSSGRVFCPDGVCGKVVEIDEPFSDGTSDHVFLVNFEGHGMYNMGFQDLKMTHNSFVH